MTDQELMEHVANLLADWPTEGTRAVMSAHFLLRERLAQPEPYDQTALELCALCGWKAQIPGDVCVMVRSREAALAMPEIKFVPVDLALVGIVDQLHVKPDGEVDVILSKGTTELA